MCGAPPDAQVHTHGLAEIEGVRVAAEVEIQKIKTTASRARSRPSMIRRPKAQNRRRYRGTLRESLRDVELKLEEATPGASEQQLALGEVVSVRDHVRRGLDLLAQRERLIKQIEGIEASKPPKRDDTIQRGLSTETAKEFADVVSEVLSAWGFPGQKTGRVRSVEL